MSNEGSPVSEKTAPTPTLVYYATHAEAFARSTANVEFSATQDRFTSLLPSGARILDLGCGSGRDAKRFLDEGFIVTATDGSPELAQIAHERTGLPIRCELFADLTDVCTYDGIWACSSILHTPKTQLGDVFHRMTSALVPDGVIYTSFKLGTFEGMRNGRYFSDFTEPEFREFVSRMPGLIIEDLWISSDVRPGREQEQWLNVLLRKQ